MTVTIFLVVLALAGIALVIVKQTKNKFNKPTDGSGGGGSPIEDPIEKPVDPREIRWQDVAAEVEDLKPRRGRPKATETPKTKAVVKKPKKQ